MISRLAGTLLEKNLKGIILDCGGVGYDVLMPLPDLTRVGQPGDKVIVRVYTHVREDVLALFGFMTQEGREAFTTLMSVTGVGPKLALSILSGIEPGDLALAVASRDLARLSGIPGVGKKTAERLCLELAGKLVPPASASSSAGGGNAVLRDLQSALLNLGYKPAAVDKVAKALEERALGGATMESLIRDALRLVAAPGES